MAAGLSVWQCVVAIIIGKIIIAAVAVANGYVGAEWHIGMSSTQFGGLSQSDALQASPSSVD